MTGRSEAEPEKSGLIVIWDAAPLVTEVVLSLSSICFFLYVLIFWRCGVLN